MEKPLRHYPLNIAMYLLLIGGIVAAVAEEIEWDDMFDILQKAGETAVALGWKP